MALFGSGFKPPGFGGDLVPPAAPSTIDTTSVPPFAIQQPRRGLFGGGGMSAEKWQMLAAGLSDAFDPLTMRPTGGGKLQGLVKERKAEAARKAQQDAFAAAYDPATGKLDPAKFIAAITAGGGEAPDAMLGALVPKDRQPQIVQTRDGKVLGIDPDEPSDINTIYEAAQEPPKPPVGTLWKDPADPSQGVIPLPGYLDAVGGLANTRAAAVAAHRAPRVGRSGGRGARSAPSSAPRGRVLGATLDPNDGW